MRYSIILVMLYSLSLTNCGNTSSKKAPDKSSSKEITLNKMDFKNLIDTIDRKVVDLTATSDLFGIDEFIKLYENSSVYRKDALLFIADTLKSEQKKQIAVLSMQNLPEDAYIDFCNSVVDLFVKDIVTEELLQTAVFFSLNSKYQIIKNYKNQVVINLLDKIKSHSQNIDLKERTDNILSGKDWKDVAESLESKKN